MGICHCNKTSVVSKKTSDVSLQNLSIEKSDIQMNLQLTLVKPKYYAIKSLYSMSQNERCHSGPDEKSSQALSVSASNNNSENGAQSGQQNENAPDFVSTESYIRINSMLKNSDHEVFKKVSSLSVNKIAEDIETENVPANNNNFNNANDIAGSIISRISSHQQYEIVDKPQKIQIDITIVNFITQNYLFKNNCNEKGIKKIIEGLIEYQVDAGVVLFKENEVGGGMYIIKSGQIEIYNNSSKTKIKLAQHDHFGELSLLSQYQIKRLYTARTKTMVDLYFLSTEIFQGSSKVDQDYFNKTLSIINKVKVLNQLSTLQKENITLLSRVVNVKKGDEIANNENFYILLSGSCIVEFENTKIIHNKANDIIGVETMLSKMEKKASSLSLPLFKQAKKIQCSLPYERIIPLEDTSFIFISQKNLIEIFGVEYRTKILYEIFNKYYHKNSFMKSIFGSDSFRFFNVFSVKRYHFSDVVYRYSTHFNHYVASNNQNRKVILIITGIIGYERTHSNDIGTEKGFLGRENLEQNEMFYTSDLISKDDFCFVLQCSFDKMKIYLDELNPEQWKKIKKISKNFLLSCLSDIKLIEVANNVTFSSYKEGETIISPKVANEHFYLVTKGEVKHVIEDKVIKVYRPNESFGEIFLIGQANKNSLFIAATPIVKTYRIEKDYFLKLIGNEVLNDRVKKKMCLEDHNILLADLYYLSYLGRGQFGNVCLVHNTIYYFAAKLVSKVKAEKDKKGMKYLLGEREALLNLSHPFIVKVVKTFQEKGWCIFLMEYVGSKTLMELMKTNQMKENVEYVKFYGAIMFLVLDYFQSKGYLHRDIKPSNLMIDSDGYLKFIDFGTAKNISHETKDFTLTVIGTPTFMAPEMINGKLYSFSCDYWSVGVCLYNIYYGKNPFGENHSDMMEVYESIIKKEVPFSFGQGNFELNSLLTNLLCKKPEERYKTLEEIKGHNFFKGFQWSELLRKKIKAPFVPQKEGCPMNEGYCTNTNTPFLSFLEFEKYSRDCLSSTKRSKTGNKRKPIEDGDVMKRFFSNNYILKVDFQRGMSKGGELENF